MSSSARQTLSLASIVCWLSLIAMPAFAYIGPGAGVGVIGTFLAIVGTVLLVIVGFLWYPIKRLIRGKKSTETAQESEEPPDES